MTRAGLVYDDKEGFSPNITFYEECRQALVKASIAGLRVVSTRTYYKDINLSGFGPMQVSSAQVSLAQKDKKAFSVMKRAVHSE